MAWVRLTFCFLGGVAEMSQGTIKKLVADRGFGFIDGDQGDVFFHHSAVKDTTFEVLHEGQSVEYDVEGGGGSKGPRATFVRPV